MVLKTNKVSKRLLMVVTSLVLLGCLISTYAASLQPTSQTFTETSTQLINASLTAMVSPLTQVALTKTPFQPINKTPTPEPTLEPTRGNPWGEYPGPSQETSIAIPPPAEWINLPKNQMTFLLMGSDQRPDRGGFRTDTIMLVTLNPDQGTSTIISIPRDLYVYIPGWTMQRINTAHAHGGFKTTAQTMAYNFGVSPERYMLINFAGFVDVIDTLGGVDVEIAKPHSDHRHGYGNFYVPAGIVKMDGETALWYVRSRYSTNDFDRTRRQQEVMLALFDKLLSWDVVNKGPEIYELFRDNVTTNITIEDILPVLPMATTLGNASKIRRFAIGPEQVTSWKTPAGAAVLLPDSEAIAQVMQAAMGSP